MCEFEALDVNGVSVKAIQACVDSMVLTQVAATGKDQFPTLPEDRANWLYNQLITSTRGYSHGSAASAAAKQISCWLEQMTPGREAEHLGSLYRFLDFRGPDVRLDIGAVLNSSRQTMPYPAFGWDWVCMQSYGWATPQHINVLELIACFNYLRAVISRYDCHGLRFFHIVDSMVTSAVLSKGRSSSKVLNRTLRRVSALALAGDLYLLPVWTVSGWNYSDHGSRYVRPRFCTNAEAT